MGCLFSGRTIESSFGMQRHFFLAPVVYLCRPKPDSKPDSKKRMVERAVAGHKGQNLRGKCAERVGTGRGVQREVF